jgi:hypothetical protein
MLGILYEAVEAGGMKEAAGFRVLSAMIEVL